MINYYTKEHQSSFKPGTSEIVLILLAVLHDAFNSAIKHSRMTTTVRGSTNARSEVSPTGRKRVEDVLVCCG
jgi:hypothetical protein